MEVVGRIASPLEWHSQFSHQLRKENVLFWYIIIGVLVHTIALIYLMADTMTCRSAEPSILDQFNNGRPELRDLNAYVDVICTTDIKARHNYSFFVSVGIIISLFLYGVALKSNLSSIKQAYFLYYRKHLDEFDEQIFRQKDIEPRTLRRQIFRRLWCYLTFKVLCSVLLIAITVTLIVLKYTTDGARDLFLPYENKCGPVLWWDEIRGKDFEIGEYYCHFNNEWTAFILMILVDVYSLFLIVGLTLSLFLSFWRFLLCCTCPCDLSKGIIDLRVPGPDKKEKYAPQTKDFEPVKSHVFDDHYRLGNNHWKHDCGDCVSSLFMGCGKEMESSRWPCRPKKV